MPSLTHISPLPLALLAIASASGAWYKLVSKHVPEPYLDEVFHVPQAQRYCKNDYTWDPKITTPPGLYLLSLFLSSIQGSCSTSSLRTLNAGAICAVYLLAYDTLRTLNRSSSSQKEHEKARVSPPQGTTENRQRIFDAHSALNISLFPPLFFFSGLYYTDVMSTLVILLSYNVFLKSRGREGKVWQCLSFVLIGIVALLFRQTNIFWVAIFPAGLALVNALKSLKEPPEDDALSILKQSWSRGYVYDPFIQKAGPSDYVLCSLSIALAALGKPVMFLKAVTPYAILLGLFAGFVVLNGGVVLGDKSNHVATIHLPQMLYVWPYIVFFSAPLAMVSFSGLVAHFFPKGPLKTFLQDNVVGSSRDSTPGIIAPFIFIFLGLAAVHFNTIIHPFTLADNRHYVFYVFRILRRHSSIKYLAVPFYYICAWTTLQTLQSDSQEDAEEQQHYGKANPMNEKIDRQHCQISFILVWLATTTLSVITAPLVEPRYFIVPWVIWRLHVPNISASHLSNRLTTRITYDLRLPLETVWLLTINAAIAYNFLYRGFSWPNEPGQVQRFLW